ncbi:hypothetical protein HDV63DRAFT_128796 [Trichoderma sp. SZMC 28014]
MTHPRVFSITSSNSNTGCSLSPPADTSTCVQLTRYSVVAKRHKWSVSLIGHIQCLLKGCYICELPMQVLRIGSIYNCLLPSRPIILQKNGAPRQNRRKTSTHLPRRSVGISELFGKSEHIYDPARCISFLRNQGIKLSAVSISVNIQGNNFAVRFDCQIKRS